MSTTPSLSTSRPRAAAGATRPRPRRFRLFRFALLLLVLALLSLLQPDCFRFAARQIIRGAAWCHGVEVQIGSLGGSLFEPVVLHDSVWSRERENGPVTRLEIKTATATFSWANLLPRRSGSWFEHLTLEDVTGKLRLPLPAENTALPPSLAWRIPRPGGRWFPMPERFEAANFEFILESNGDYVRLLRTNLTLGKVEAGSISAGEIQVRQPWLTHTFRNVTGTTTMQDGVLQATGLTLEPGMVVQDFSTALRDFARGQVKFAAKLAAFGGELRADVQILPDEPKFSIDVAVPFSKIDVAKLAAFLGVSEAAGGTIKTGRFTFRGPPQQFAKASAELRFEAENFQWETRQWDSLVLGAKLLNGRIEVPELALAQGRNRLKLSGEMVLPARDVEWWRSEFSCNIEAKIENLTELSALLLPEFKFAAGRANIDGSIRGKDRQFHGQLIASGSDLRWRSAPIEELHASVKLNGNEYQLTSFSLFNAGDYVRGRGVMNIIGDKQYWGEMHTSVQDLAKYAALLQKPVLPEPLAGGAFIDWDGEGSAKGHSGKFLARLRKVRSLGATAALLHPINADFEASYSKGGLAFSTFALSDDESSFTARVGVLNKAVSLQGLRLTHGRDLWLEGDALLPLDLWNAWPNLSFARLLDDHTVGKLNLNAYNLSLRETAQLTGMNFPLEGLVRGNVTAEGPVGKLKTSGQLTLTKGRIPLGWSGHALTGVEGAVSLTGQKLRFEKLTGQHPTGDFRAGGDIDFTDLRNPMLQLEVASAKSRLRLFAAQDDHAGLLLDTALSLRLSGPLSHVTVRGEAKVGAAAFMEPFADDWSRLLIGDSAGELPPVWAMGGTPWKVWRFEVRTTAENVALLDQSMSADLRLTGTGATPALVGNVRFTGPATTPPPAGLVVAPGNVVRLQQASLEFRDGFPTTPVISAQAAGMVSAEPFAIYVTGLLPDPMRVFHCQPPLTEKAIRAAIGGDTAARFFTGESRFSLLVPVELRESVAMADWPEIKAEPAPEAAPQPGNAGPPTNGTNP